MVAELRSQLAAEGLDVFHHHASKGRVDLVVGPASSAQGKTYVFGKQ
jgi:hypothetical protein